MDWSAVKKAIGTIAPWIAGTLGTPVAGAAVGALCNVFGLSGDQATPENALKALSGATPEQLLALKSADNQHAEFMAQLGYKNIEDLEQIAASDRDSARKREMAVRDNTPRVLAYLVTAGFFALLALLAFHTVPIENEKILDVMVGSLGTAWISMIAYYYGTNSASNRKTEIIAKAQPIKE